MKAIGRTNPMMQPIGPDKDAIVVAIDRSLSPNQSAATFVGACTMNVHPNPAIVCPIMTMKKPCSKEFTNSLTHAPKM